MKIFKDDYKRYRDCAKVAWLMKRNNFKLAKKFHDSELLSYFFALDDPDSNSHVNWDQFDLTSEVSDFEGETLEDGKQVGEEAKKYFSSKYKVVDLTFIKDPEKAAKLTVKALSDPECEVIFEARFEFNECVAKSDILLRKKNTNRWDIIEVKAVNNTKKEHMLDLLYQYYVLTNCGINISNLFLMHLNALYVRQGDLNYEELFVINPFYMKTKTKSENIYEAVKNDLEGRNFEEDIKALKEILDIKDKQQILKFLKSPYCQNRTNTLKKPYCFHVTEYVPKNDTIFNLYRMRKVKKAKLYYEKNYLSLKNFIPEEDDKLTPMQLRQIAAVNDPNQIIDFENFGELLIILSDYKYPIYMYDFETMKSAIPKFNNSKPYQQIPFQYSIHVLVKPDFDEKTMHNIYHYEYLPHGDEDPRPEFAKRLAEDMKKHGVGTYVAYNKSFECNICLRPLSEISPPQIAKDLLIYREKTIDLMDFFRHFYIYHPKFNGSISIKKTLPAFQPGFSYDQLQIQKGDMAAEIFRQWIEHDVSEDIWLKNIRPALLAYCGQDTWSMVILFSEVKKLIEKENNIKPLIKSE